MSTIRTDEDIKKDVFDQLFWDSRIDDELAVHRSSP